MSVVMDSKAQGDVCYRSGQYQQACELYQRAIKEMPSSALYLNLALCSFQLQKFDDCVEACAFALTLDQNYAKARYRRALALEQLGRLSEAIEDFRIVKESCSLREATDGLHRCISLLKDSAPLTHTCQQLTQRIKAEDLTALPEFAKTLVALQAVDSKKATRAALDILLDLHELKAFAPTAEMLDALTKSGANWQVAEESQISALCRAAQLPSQSSATIPVLCCLFDNASKVQERAVVAVLCTLLASQYQQAALRGFHTVLVRSHLPGPALHSLLRRNYCRQLPVALPRKPLLTSPLFATLLFTATGSRLRLDFGPYSGDMGTLSGLSQGFARSNAC
jgi:hypothetical protein